jgi:hypothetical protein
MDEKPRNNELNPISIADEMQRIADDIKKLLYPYWNA